LYWKIILKQAWFSWIFVTCILHDVRWFLKFFSCLGFVKMASMWLMCLENAMWWKEQVLNMGFILCLLGILKCVAIPFSLHAWCSEILLWWIGVGFYWRHVDDVGGIGKWFGRICVDRSVVENMKTKTAPFWKQNSVLHHFLNYHTVCVKLYKRSVL
jgi:hypothetical protein